MRKKNWIWFKVEWFGKFKIKIKVNLQCSFNNNVVYALMKEQ
jgi:hypothetical protein